MFRWASRIRTWAKAHKDTLSVILSVLALAGTGVNYYLDTWWHLHSLTVIPIGAREDSGDATVWLVFANEGKRNEVVANFEIAGRHHRVLKDGQSETEEVTLGSAPEPFVLGPSSATSIAINFKGVDWNALRPSKKKYAADEIEFGVRVQYIDPHGLVESKFIKLGRTKIEDGKPMDSTLFDLARDSEKRPVAQRLF
jgi:hypothetical protein